MTRIHSTLQLLLQRLRRAGRAQRRFVMMNLDELDPMPLGPGWFDSSWELEQGLEVCEDAAADIAFQPWRESVREPVREPVRDPLCEPVREPLRDPVREPVLAQPRSNTARTDNSIEFELTDASAWRLPAKPSHAPRHAELELALA